MSWMINKFLYELIPNIIISVYPIIYIHPPGMSWMINSGQGLLPMAGVRTGLSFGTAADQTAQYFQVKQE